MLAQCGLGDKWINSQFLTIADDRATELDILCMNYKGKRTTEGTSKGGIVA